MLKIIIRLHSSSSSVRPPIKFKFTCMPNTDKFHKKRKYKEIDCANSKLSNKDNILISSDLLNGCTSDLKYNNTLSENEYIYGIFPVLLSLKARRRSFKSFYYKNGLLNKNEYAREIYSICQDYGIPSHCINKRQLTQLIGNENVHQGVCLEASRLSFAILDNLDNVDHLELHNSSGKCKLWLFLDQINDPMNFGAILRTAHYLGIDKVLSSKENSCPITSTVSKASSGAAEILPVFQLSNEIKILKSLQELNWQIIGSSVSSKDVTIPLHEFQLTKNSVLIVGNEGSGISKGVESIADVLVSIPSNSYCDNSIKSLNVSVATSILLYSLLCMHKL